MNAKGAKKAPKKKTNGYQMAEPIKKGEILTDLKKNRWIIGSSIGVGGFGEIYEAALYKDKTPKEYPAVIKIEPHGNGPLFVEMHFYMRNANPDEIEAWRKKKKLSNLGMPKFLGSGSHEYNGTKYRFLVVERYGTDLWKLFNENGRCFPEHTVYNVALQVVDVLEFIHNKKYIHGDIKGGNLLLDLKSPKEIYLVDFGLACHYTTKDEYKPDPRKAHDGTPEYTSRDAHNGVPTMRGDMEILGYNIVQWLCGTLPWEKDMKDPTKVQKQKEEAFKKLDDFLNKCFQNSVPDTITQFMKLIKDLKYQEVPAYDKFRDILIKGLQRLKKEPYGKLEFKGSDKPNKMEKEKEKKKGKVEKTLRVDVIRVPTKKDNNLDVSVNTLVNEKFESGAAAINHLLDNVDFDSDSEYDIQIKKRRKKVEKSTETDTPVKKRQGRKKKAESGSEDEHEGTPKRVRGRQMRAAVAVKTTPRRTPKSKPKYVDDSDDMFDE